MIQDSPEHKLSPRNESKNFSNIFSSGISSKADKHYLFYTPETKTNTKQFFANTDIVNQKRNFPTLNTCNNNNNTSNTGSPHKEVISDRFIPIRSPSIARNLFEIPNETFMSPQKIEPFTEEAQNQIKYNSLLENRLLDVKHSDFFSRFTSTNKKNINISPFTHTPNQNRHIGAFESNFESDNWGGNDKPMLGGCTNNTALPKLLKFKTPLRENKPLDSFNCMKSSSLMEIEDDEKTIFEAFKPYRKISKTPYKILDAPSLQDDFYLNLINWSSKNQLAVSLGQAVWVWNGDTSEVYRFAYKDEHDECEYSSVQWDSRGHLLAVGDYNGKLEIWDVNVQKRIRVFAGHRDRIDCISWNGANNLSSGSRDRTILTRELRSPHAYIMKYEGHKDEVCGLKWSYNGQQLASGGNDNRVFIWSSRKTEPEARFRDHTSAVKALAWSPHQQGLLLTGGGYTDKSIKAWNTLSLTLLNSIQTESQICNMLFSKNSNEFVTTHGLHGNQIMIWKYPELLKICLLDGPQGHAERVLYLSDSPNGENIVTGASDETLKFWKVFPSKSVGGQSNLYPSMQEIR